METLVKIEAPIRLVETNYNHQYLEIPTEKWPLVQRWEWIKAIITGGDIVHRFALLQHIDLKPMVDSDDSKMMP